MADTAKVVPVVPVASLSSSTANSVVSTLKNPPEQMWNTEGSTVTCFWTLWSQTSAPASHQLLTPQGLSDSQPSKLRDKMLALLGHHKPDFLFLHLFLNQLPTQVQAVLANAAITDCWTVAEEADKIFLVRFQHYVTHRLQQELLFFFLNLSCSVAWACSIKELGAFWCQNRFH